MTADTAMERIIELVEAESNQQAVVYVAEILLHYAQLRRETGRDIGDPWDHFNSDRLRRIHEIKREAKT